MKPAVRVTALILLAVLCAEQANAQRGRFRRRPGGGGAPTPPPPAAEPQTESVKQWLAIVGGDVHVGDGRILRGATVLLGDDKVREVGHDLDIDGAKTIDARGKVVTPGYVAVKASGIAVQRGDRDGNLADSVNPFDPRIKMALAVGITAFIHQNGRGQGKPGGSGALVKLAWGDAKAMVRKTDVAYSMRTPLSAGDWQSFRDAVKKAKEFLAKQSSASPVAASSGGGETAAAGARGSRGAPRGRGGRPGGGGAGGPGGASARGNEPPSGSKEIVAILEGKAKLWINLEQANANDTDAILQAVEVAELLGKGVVLDDPVSAWLVADRIARTDSMVVLNPRQDVAPDPLAPDQTGTNLASAAILAEAGVPVAVTCPSGRFGGPQIGTTGIMGQDLNTPQVDAAFAVRGGLPDHLALRTLTLDAARAAGADDIVGSLEPGKDADVLILDGDPLSYKTFVEIAVVNGKVVYEKDEESYYGHVKR